MHKIIRAITEQTNDFNVYTLTWLTVTSRPLIEVHHFPKEDLETYLSELRASRHRILDHTVGSRRMYTANTSTIVFNNVPIKILTNFAHANSDIFAIIDKFNSISIT